MDYAMRIASKTLRPANPTNDPNGLSVSAVAFADDLAAFGDSVEDMNHNLEAIRAAFATINMKMHTATSQSGGQVKTAFMCTKTNEADNRDSRKGSASRCDLQGNVDPGATRTYLSHDRTHFWAQNRKFLAQRCPFDECPFAATKTGN